MKSAELTGIWEKKLRDIEAKKYDPVQFVDELKQQITEIVRQVIADQSNRFVTVTEEGKPANGAKAAATKKAPSSAKKGSSKKGKQLSPSSSDASGAGKQLSPPSSDVSGSGRPLSPPSSDASGSGRPLSPPSEGSGEASLVGQPCPLCGKGHIIKGKTAYGCSEWKSGCTWRQPFAT